MITTQKLNQIKMLEAGKEQQPAEQHCQAPPPPAVPAADPALLLLQAAAAAVAAAPALADPAHL